MIKFAYSGLFRVYADEIGKDGWDWEIVDQSYTSLPMNVPIDEEMDYLRDGFEFPKVEGIYSVWATGSISYHCDYFGEWDVDVEPVVLEIQLAGLGDTEMANAIIANWDKTAEEIAADQVVKFEE